MSNMYLDCGLNSRLVWQKLKLIKNKRSLFLKLLLNNFMQISVEGDDPNKSPAVFCWLLMKYCWTHAVCLTDFSRNQLLCPKTLATFLPIILETFDHMLGNHVIGQVSPMFISEHANTWDAKQILQILFVNNPNKFFVIPKVCLSKCVFHCLNTCSRRFTLECGFTFLNTSSWSSVERKPFERKFKGSLNHSSLLRLSKRC